MLNIDDTITTTNSTNSSITTITTFFFPTGCGAFKGDFQLKFLCQLIAASQASFYHNNKDNYELMYFTFFDKELAQKLKTMHHLLVQLEVTVSELYNLMVKYWTDKKDPSHSVFDYIVSELVGC